MSETSSLTKTLARYAAAARFDDLPDEVRDMAKLCILDSLCSIVIGRHLRAGELAAKYAQLSGGQPTATVIGSPWRASPEIAAFANGTAAHADEIDDVGETHNHPGAAVIPAVLAIAEKTGSSGAEVINAVVLGYDVCARVMRTIGPQRDLMVRRHTLGDSFMVFGAAAAAGRLLGLDAARQEHNLAISTMHAGTTMVYMAERDHITKAMNLGKAAQNGVFSATLASMGFEGVEDVFETQHGVIETWAGDLPREALVAGLGEDFEVLKTHFKFYSAGHPIHAPVHAVLGLLAEHGLEAEQIEELHLHVTTYAAYIVADRNTPSICLQDMVAVAAVLGRLGVREAHDERNFALPAVWRLRQRIVVHRDPEMDARDPAGFGAHVTMRTADGRTLKAEVPLPPGDYREEPRADWDRLERKFRDLSGEHLDAATIDTIVRHVGSLESMVNVSPLMTVLSTQE